MIPRRSLLGEQIAENDKNLLLNFIETPEYRSIIETKDGTVVVGRRGTGKSAIFLKLDKFWGGQKGNYVIKIAPEDYQTISFRTWFNKFDNNYNCIRAVSRIVWKYSIFMEILNSISVHYKSRTEIDKYEIVKTQLNLWKEKGGNFFSRMTSRLNLISYDEINKENIVSKVPIELNITEIEDAFVKILSGSKIRIYVLIDRLDEGFENDRVGAAIISGAISCISDINKHHEKVRMVIFQRDNIMRSVQKYDPDYTRNIEGEVISLHWSIHLLQSLVAKRLNNAFGLNMEKSQRIWDHCVADIGYERELKGVEGFKKCLQFTLYRPRDILSLLNQAFFVAMGEERDKITISDIERTAREISRNRLDDLKKEYKSTFPSICFAISAFESRHPEISYVDALELIDNIKWDFNKDVDVSVFQDYKILSGDGIIRVLYSIGFFGIHDKNSNSFTFCHDGRGGERELTNKDTLLIHPCYWIALNLSKNALYPNEMEQINDEYEINVVSTSPEIRSRKIESLRSELDQIKPGREHAYEFQAWVKRVIEVIFAGHLVNIENAPNGAAVQRRDIVGTNSATSPVWKRINSDYDVRQVVFDAKNYSELGVEDFQQMSSYLHDRYGRLGFIVTRGKDENLHTGRELDHVRNIYVNEKKLVVILPCTFLIKLLNKLRNPEKHDTVDALLSKLLDKYERSYLSLPSSRKNK